MKDINQLDSIHFDILREVGNIGAGNAVTSLAKMLNKKVDMNVPLVRMLGFREVSEILGDPESLVFGILVTFSGDLNGMMMFVLKREPAKTLINSMLEKEFQTADEFSELDRSALQEIGNILSSSYLSALSTLINKRIIPSVPFLAEDMAAAILSVPAIEFGKMADCVLFIESVFEGTDEPVSGYFIMIPDLPSFDTILSSLGAY